MPRELRWANDYVGGGVGALDKIDGAYLEDLEATIVVTGTMATFHSLDDDLSGAESAPSIINPDTNAGTKSHVLVGITLPNTGLHILDTDASHDLIIKPGSDLSADRTLTLTTGDADRTITIDEDITASAYVKEADFDADTFLYATSDNTPVATSPANVMAALSGHAAATFDFNSEDVSHIKHLGLGEEAAVTDIGLLYQETITITDNVERFGAACAPIGVKTSAAFTSHLVGLIGVAYLGAANTQDWTNAAALIANEGRAQTLAGSTGTITGMRSFYARCTIADAASVTNWQGLYIQDATVAGSKLTNAYGIYIEDINSGSGLNYNIYSAGGDCYLAGDINIASHDGATVGLELGGTLVTASAAELNANDGITANGTSLIQAADYAAMLALLSGEAGTAFSFNSQNLTSVGTIGCGDITTTGDYLLANGNYVGVSANERLEFYTAGYAAFMACDVGIYTATPIRPLDVLGTTRVYDTDSGISPAMRIENDNSVTLDMRVDGSAIPGAIFGQTRADGAQVFSASGTLTIGAYSACNLYLGTNNLTRVTIASGGDVDIIAHDAATLGLKLGGTLVTSSAGELNLNDGSVAGTIVNSKSVIYGASGEVNATTLEIAGNLLNVTTDGTDTTVVGALNVTALAGADPATHKAVYYNTTTKSLFYDNT